MIINNKNKEFMYKNVMKVAVVAVIAMVAGINVFNAQNPVELSDVAMANVEALANNEYDRPFFSQCPTCEVCRGEVCICESGLDRFFEDAQRNCSALDVMLYVMPDCWWCWIDKIGFSSLVILYVKRELKSLNDVKIWIEVVFVFVQFCRYYL